MPKEIKKKHETNFQNVHIKELHKISTSAETHTQDGEKKNRILKVR